MLHIVCLARPLRARLVIRFDAARRSHPPGERQEELGQFLTAPPVTVEKLARSLSIPRKQVAEMGRSFILTNKPE